MSAIFIAFHISLKVMIGTYHIFDNSMTGNLDFSKKFFAVGPAQKITLSNTKEKVFYKH